VPDTIEHEILENDEFLIIATDGIWEFISNEEAVRIVGSSSDAKEATSRLSALAWTKWLSAEDDLVDDITVIVETF
jgi:serine/threonine protein phosphatase PrpC